MRHRILFPGMDISIPRNTVNPAFFNPHPWFPPYELRTSIFQEAMQDIYDFFYDVNMTLLKRGLPRLDDMLRPAAMSGIISDMLTARIAAHSQTLTENRYFNGHPDLIVRGIYANDAVKAGTEGIEIKTTKSPADKLTRMVRASRSCACSCMTWTRRQNQRQNAVP